MSNLPVLVVLTVGLGKNRSILRFVAFDFFKHLTMPEPLFCLCLDKPYIIYKSSVWKNDLFALYL